MAVAEDMAEEIHDVAPWILNAIHDAETLEGLSYLGRSSYCYAITKRAGYWAGAMRDQFLPQGP